MPHTTTIDCPHCERPMPTRRGGRCPNCNQWVADHVAKARLKEKRIEQVVAIFATVAVLTLFLWGGGVGLLEGIVVYAVVGIAVWYWGRGTFFSETLRREKPDDAEANGDDHDPR